MAARELRPLRVGEIIDAALKVYRRNVLTLWKIIAVVVVPVNLVGALLLLSVLPTDFFDDSFGATTSLTTSEQWSILAASLVVGLIGAATVIAATAACLKVVSDTYMGRSSDARSSLAFATRRLHSLLWVVFLTVLLIFVIALLAVLTALVAGPLAIVFAVPIIWLYVAWSFATPALLVEGTRGRAALGRSFNLVRGRWWPVFGALVLGMIITWIVGIGIGALLNPLIDSADSFTTAVLYDAVARSISAIVTTPFSAALVGILYFDLRVRKEGFDVQLLAERIGEPGPAAGALPPEAGPQR
ncbi:MAG TPA: hypothetical protein VEU29_06970 [Actinomycetota bacterium]|nr:hypothetical protein [Actinomycetota bacterium]